jgi:O-antigen/teichoic acid export membrane protein
VERSHEWGISGRQACFEPQFGATPSRALLSELLRRSAWLAIGSAVGRVAPLVALIAAGKQFDAQGYASVSAAFAWIAIAHSLSSSGLAVVLIQRLGGLSTLATQRVVLGQHMRVTMLVCTCVSMLALAYFAWGLRLSFGEALSSAVIWPAALAALVWSQVTLVTSGLIGSGRVRAASALILCSGVLQGGAMGVGLLVFRDPAAVVWALVCGSALAAVLATWHMRRVWGASVLRRPPTDPVPAPLPTGPILWHTLASSCVLPVGFWASSFIAHGPGGQRQLALYFSLEQLYLLLIYLPSIVGQAMLTLISRRHASSAANPHQSHEIVSIITRAALLAALLGPCVALLVTAYPAPLASLLGRAFELPQDAWALRWMAVGASLWLSVALLSSALLGRGQFVLMSQLNMAWGAAFVAGTWLLAASGTAGLQIARIGAGLLLVLLSAAALLRSSRVPASPAP